MVNDYRIKSYRVPLMTADNVGSQITQYTNFAINGELLRLDIVANFTGSIIIKQSGMAITLLNATTTSGTGAYQSFPFSNAVGSFVTLSPLQITVSGLMSGTGIVAGPMELLYR